ncbi:MAG: hypothetical protein JNJ99_17320 [Crocinitomicaceae bacterium]|nr:hypothetical protein [Crocinitomicaceae bacterium]
MKFKALLLLSPVIFLFSFIAEEEENTNELTWSADRPLLWSDFTGDVDRSSSFDAWTYSGINYVYTWYYDDNNKIKADINAWAYFDHSQSWVKRSAISEELLQHEQLHFDIAELHCRYFLEASLNYTYTENVEAEIDSIYNVYFEKMLSTQIDYDMATDHFRNKEEQIKWNQHVHSELDRLIEYDFK